MKKLYSILGVSLIALSLAACDNADSSLGMYGDDAKSSEESVVSSSSLESASLNVVEPASSETESVETSVASTEEADVVVEESSELVVEDSVATEAAAAQAMTAEEIESSIAAAQPETYNQESEVVPSSQVENTETSSEQVSEPGAYDNTRSRELLAEAAPLILAHSQDAYQSDEYFFLPTLVNEDLAQIDVYRQSPDGQGHSNLIATYRYDAYSGTLMVMDILSGTWENAGNLNQ